MGFVLPLMDRDSSCLHWMAGPTTASHGAHTLQKRAAHLHSSSLCKKERSACLGAGIMALHHVAPHDRVAQPHRPCALRAAQRLIRRTAAAS